MAKKVTKSSSPSRGGSKNAETAEGSTYVDYLQSEDCYAVLKRKNHPVTKEGLEPEILSLHKTLEEAEGSL